MGLFGFKRQKQIEHIRQPHLLYGQDTYTFRRSRTLTGTTSPDIATSAEARSQLKTPRLKIHELQHERARVLRLLITLGIGIIFIGFLLLNYIGSFTIVYVQQASQSGPATTEYQKTLQEYFTSQPLQRFGFALNGSQLEGYMTARHNELADFTVSRGWYGGGVQFTADFRKPLLVWQTGGQRFYVDSQGIAFNYNDFGGSLVPVEDLSGIAPDSSGSVASQRFIRFLGQMVGAVNAGGMGQVSSVVIPASTREIDIKLQGREYPIKTHINRDPLQQAQDIINALKYFDTHKIKPEYVDVRVSGKAFYK